MRTQFNPVGGCKRSARSAVRAAMPGCSTGSTASPPIPGATSTRARFRPGNACRNSFYSRKQGCARFESAFTDAWGATD